jgi:N-acetylneuraminate synthase/N,N'-diacetyllegionaminate synthase
MKSIKVAKHRFIGFGQPVFITVDIGKNHNGSIEESKWLIDKAVEAGVDAVKFQTHGDDEQRKLDKDYYSPHFDKIDRYSWVKKNIMSSEFWIELKEYAESKGAIFYSTPMSVSAAKLLGEIGVPLFKVGSADVTDLFMIEEIAKTGKPVIISTGMNKLEDIELAVKKVKEYHNKIILMHCVSEYPCPPEHLNLKAINFLRKKFGLPVGLSDHVLEIETASAAVALGAVAIEKHFTRDRNEFGPDHKASLLPEELKLMVKNIRNVEKAMGNGKKELLEGESKFIPMFHKSITAKIDIPEGTIITQDMIAAKRPGEGGLAPKLVARVVGKKTKTDIKKDSLILLEDLE